MDFISSLLTSKAGRTFLKWGAALGLAGLFLLRAFTLGRQSERNHRMQSSLQNFRKRTEIDADISRNSDANRRHRLQRWTRK